MIRKIEKLAIDALLSTKEMPLNFHEHILATESVDEELRAVCRILGSARVSRVGDGVLAITNFSGRMKSAASCESFKRLFRGDTETNTRDACATQNSANRAQFLINTFGRENVFVEIQRHFLRGEERINRQLLDLANHYRLRLVATNGVQYAKSYGREVLDVFTCIREHTHLDAAGKLLTQNSERHLKSESEMRELFRDLPEAIENTSHLTERLIFSLENLGYEFPEFPVPAGHSMDSFLRTFTWLGA